MSKLPVGFTVYMYKLTAQLLQQQLAAGAARPIDAIEHYRKTVLRYGLGIYQSKNLLNVYRIGSITGGDVYLSIFFK